MVGNLDPNELALTVVDQAHQIRRMNDMLTNQQDQIGQLAAANTELQKALEAKSVAAEIAEDSHAQEAIDSRDTQTPARGRSDARNK